jgi:hypothetical protein
MTPHTAAQFRTNLDAIFFGNFLVGLLVVKPRRQEKEAQNAAALPFNRI